MTPLNPDRSNVERMAFPSGRIFEFDAEEYKAFERKHLRYHDALQEIAARPYAGGTSPSQKARAALDEQRKTDGEVDG